MRNKPVAEGDERMPQSLVKILVHVVFSTKHRAVGGRWRPDDFVMTMRIALVLFATVSISGCSSIPIRKKVLAKNPSPSYSVALYEPLSSAFLLGCAVYGDVEKDGSSYVADVPVMLSDDLSCRFDQTHTSREWISDRILRFQYFYEESEDFDEVVVRNTTDKLMKVLKVDTGDIHLLMDIQPKEKMAFQTRHRQGTRFVSSFGKGDLAVVRGGQDLAPAQVPGKQTTCIYVNDNDISIRRLGSNLPGC